MVVAATMSLSCTNAMNGDDSTISSADVLKKIKAGKTVTFERKTITGDLDFTQVDANSGAGAFTPVYVECELNFLGCTFEGEVRGYAAGEGVKGAYCVFERNVCFDGCTFAKDVSLNQADYRGRFAFTQCTANGKADFSGSRFAQSATFTKSIFHGDAFFVSSVFGGRATFFGATFDKAFNVQFCRFGDITMFADASFKGYVEMSRAYAAAQFDFVNSKFRCPVTACDAVFVCGLRLCNTLFEKRLELTGNTFLGALDLRGADVEAEISLSRNIYVAEPLVDIVKGKDFAIEEKDNKLVDSKEFKIVNN